jgi:hypothetical protein
VSLELIKENLNYLTNKYLHITKYYKIGATYLLFYNLDVYINQPMKTSQIRRFAYSTHH